MALIFALWAQCDSEADARAFAAHFESRRLLRDDGVEMSLAVSRVADKCCWIAPSDVSRAGAYDAAAAARLTAAGEWLYELLATAPEFSIALVGIEVDDVRSDEDIAAMIAAAHPPGLVVAESLWHRAGAPPAFALFRPGYRWLTYRGE